MKTRRSFLKASALTSLAATSIGHAKNASPSKRVRVGVMGLKRGMAHVNSYLKIPGVEIAYLCDVDQRRLESAAQHVAKEQDTKPQKVTDFRKILDDSSIDALSIAARGCRAGGHRLVYRNGAPTACTFTIVSGISVAQLARALLPLSMSGG